MVLASNITDFLTIDLGTIVPTLINLLVMFLVIKHFLFKPIMKVINSRKEEVANTYKEADEAKDNAKKLKAEYTQKLSVAKEESAEIVRDATKKAQLRSDEIISEAKNEAKGIVDNAHSEIEREKKIAVNQIKDEITDIAFSAAEAVCEKQIDKKDNEKLIEEFINSVGEM